MNTRLIKLSDSNNFFQNAEGYKFSADSLMLYEYISRFKTDTFIELGCGEGIISVLYALKYPASQIRALDINPAFLENLKKTISENNIKNITTVNSDFVEYSIISRKKFDLVVFNPPYYHPSEGKINPATSALTSKHQIFFPQYELAFSPARLTDKRFIMIYPSFKITNQFIDLFYKAGFNEIELIDTNSKRFKIVDVKK